MGARDDSSSATTLGPAGADGRCRDARPRRPVDGRRARRYGRWRLRRATGAGRSPQGCRDHEGEPDAGKVLGGMALALEPVTHHAIARLPGSAVFTRGCVYSVGVSVYSRGSGTLCMPTSCAYTPTPFQQSGHTGHGEPLRHPLLAPLASGQ